MKQAAFIFLSAGLIGIGCSKEDEAEALADPKPCGVLTPPPVTEGIKKLNPTNYVPVLAERNGRYYQVYEIAEKTFSGKVVL